jgi:hypothetical protein
MSTEIIVLILLSFILIFFFFSLRRSYGVTRSLGITLLRGSLILPLVLSLKPKTKEVEESIFIKKHNIQALLDDSLSTKTYPGKRSFFEESKELLKKLQEKCLTLGCDIQVTKLSETQALTQENYTPLASSLNFMFKAHKEKPILIFTDGYDYQKNISWEEKFFQEEIPKEIKLITPTSKNAENLWIESVLLPDVGFHTKKIESTLLLKRNENFKKKITVQLQALVAGEVVQTKTIHFLENLSEVSVLMSLPPLQRGLHILEFKVLPSAKESSYDDNKTYRKIEILSNTKGILHLLGSPSWDGRFLRQHLKSEPKYDLVSFYILRDPHDTQNVSEREMSLIPFPAERLFTEELKNFHLIIMQNFSLTKFLHPTYQKNLVSFVKDGGGLLFLGGDKSLTEEDLTLSPLKEIIPFRKKDNEREEILFDKDLSFSIKLANPTEEDTNLATLFHDYYDIESFLENKKTFSGLHLIQDGFVDKEESTPLLSAYVEGKAEYPLALASYPGKGRAVWFLTDSLWKLAFNPSGEVSRNIYNKLIDSSLEWLLKEETLKPLKVEKVKNFLTENNQIRLEILLEGSTLQYLEQKNTAWTLSLCKTEVLRENIEVQKKGEKKAILAFSLDRKHMKESECLVELKIRNPVFGEEKAQMVTLLPLMEKDLENTPPSDKELQSLAQILKTDRLEPNSETEKVLELWLKKITNEEKIKKRTLTRLYKEPYWPLENSLVWLFLLVIPLEIFIRKWRVL